MRSPSRGVSAGFGSSRALGALSVLGAGVGAAATVGAGVGEPAEPGELLAEAAELGAGCALEQPSERTTETSREVTENVPRAVRTLIVFPPLRRGSQALRINGRPEQTKRPKMKAPAALPERTVRQ